MIYERLEALGRLDDYRKFNPPKDFRKRSISDANRHTVRWALEVSQQEQEQEDRAEAAAK